jgi:diguanylate cyclase (GGDEF)-like protein
VIAEGVETKEEYLAAKDIGCDLAQGYFVARPEQDLDKIHLRYEEIELVSTGDKRLASSSKSSRDRQFIEEKLDRIPPIPLGSTFAETYEAFRRSPQNSYLPVVDSKTGSFVGIVREPNVRYYIYSPFGRELLENKYYGKKLADFVTYFPVADIGLGLEKILEVMHQSQDSDGIVILENSRYLGFLSAISMIRVINERNLFTAQNQNPLSGLPGNAAIIDFVNETIGAEEESAVLVYFDFDNFKPFNDTYGFRQGDRAIMLFTDLMKKRFATTDAFLGHVGGDDFFLGIRGLALAEFEGQIRSLLDAFRQDVESFYSPEAREAGYIEVKDRNDEVRRFPMMGVSAAVIEMPSGPRTVTVDALSSRFAELKKLAKKQCRGYCAAMIAG